MFKIALTTRKCKRKHFIQPTDGQRKAGQDHGIMLSVEGFTLFVKTKLTN